MGRIYQEATIDNFKKLKKGDEFICFCERALYKEIAAGAAFYNFDADMPGWEIETESGFYWCLDSIYIPI